MKLRLPPALVRILAPVFIDPLAHSWRFDVRNGERRQRLVDAGRPFIYLLWHEALLPLLWQHRGQQVAIVVSEAREGQYLADYARRIGYELVPGSSTRGGSRALLRAIRVLDDGNAVAFTPDGPRGPRRAMKPGVVHAARRAGAMILPLHAVARSAWQLGSWDRMMVPKPFSRIALSYGEPFMVPDGPDGFAEGLTQCATALADLEQEIGL